MIKYPANLPCPRGEEYIPHLRIIFVRSILVLSNHLRLDLPSSSFLYVTYTQAIIYYISTVNTQRMHRPDVLLQLGYIWRDVSAVNRPSSGQQRIVLIRYSQIVVQWDPIVYIKPALIILFFVGLRMAGYDRNMSPDITQL